MWSYGPAHEEKKKKTREKSRNVFWQENLSYPDWEVQPMKLSSASWFIPQSSKHSLILVFSLSISLSATLIHISPQFCNISYFFFFLVFFFQPVNVTILLLILELNQSFQWRHTLFLATNLLLYWILTTLSPLRTPCSPRIIFRFLDS